MTYRLIQSGPLTWSLLVVLFFVVAPAIAADETPDLNGRWVLNEEESDDPREKFSRGGGMHGGRGGRGMGGGTMGGGRGGDMPPGGRGGGGYGGGQRMMGDPNRFRELTITQMGDQISFRFADDSERTLYTDGRYEDENGYPLLATAAWQKRKLRVEREGQRGTMVETYELKAQGGRLFVTVKMEGGAGGRSMSFKRVYDRAGADTGVAEVGG